MVKPHFALLSLRSAHKAAQGGCSPGVQFQRHSAVFSTRNRYLSLITLGPSALWRPRRGQLLLDGSQLADLGLKTNYAELQERPSTLLIQEEAAVRASAAYVAVPFGVSHDAQWTVLEL